MYASHGTQIRIYDTSQESLNSAEKYISSAFKDGSGIEEFGEQHGEVTYHVDNLDAVVRGVWMVIGALPEKLPFED